MPRVRLNRWVGFSNLSLHMATPTSAAAFQATTNRLTAASYDDAGNLTAHPNITIGGGTITYDANNKQAAFTKTGTTVDTWYDAQDRRVRKVVNGATTIYVYDAFGKLAAEYTTATLNGPRGTFYRTTDHLGSTRLVTDSNGAILQRRDFFPFGEEIPADSSHGNRNTVADAGLQTFNAALGVTQQFTGQERDDETGLDYFGGRNLFGPIAQFLSVDPGNAGASLTNPQGWNAYGYVYNNPLRFVDPLGLCPDDPNAQPDEDGVYDCGFTFIADGVSGSNASPGGAGGGGTLPSVESGDEMLDAQLDCRPDRSPCVDETVASIPEESCTAAEHITGECGGDSVLPAMALRNPQLLAAWMLMTRLVGRMGEAVVSRTLDLAKNTTFRLSSTLSGRERIPDFIDDAARKIHEVKNASSLSFNSQIRDMAFWAENNGYRFVLWVREGAKLSKPLREAVAKSNGRFEIRTIGQ